MYVDLCLTHLNKHSETHLHGYTPFLVQLEENLIYVGKKEALKKILELHILLGQDFL